MNLNRIITLCAVAATLAISASSLLAQDNGNNNGGGQRRNRQNGGPGGGNFDPAQMQQRMLDRVQEQLGFTNDTEWDAGKPLVQKVMTARQEVWKRVKLNRQIPLLIDARMGAEFARLYSVHPTNVEEIEFYEENLYTAEEAERLPCSARAIIYCPTVIGGLIALQVKAHATGTVPAREVLFDLPSLRLITASASALQSTLVA